MNDVLTNQERKDFARSDSPALQQSDQFARNVLMANAAFSIASGLLLLLGTSMVLGWLGLSGETATILIRMSGGGILLFAGFVAWVASRRPISTALLLDIAVADFVWVFLSAVILLGGWIPFSSGGKWVVALVADVVLLLGVLEVFAWRRLRSAR
jgi:hypothetical protein